MVKTARRRKDVCQKLHASAVIQPTGQSSGHFKAAPIVAGSQLLRPQVANRNWPHQNNATAGQLRRRQARRLIARLAWIEARAPLSSGSLSNWPHALARWPDDTRTLGRQSRNCSLRNWRRPTHSHAPLNWPVAQLEPEPSAVLAVVVRQDFKSESRLNSLPRLGLTLTKYCGSPIDRVQLVCLLAAKSNYK